MVKSAQGGQFPPRLDRSPRHRPIPRCSTASADLEIRATKLARAVPADLEIRATTLVRAVPADLEIRATCPARATFYSWRRPTSPCPSFPPHRGQIPLRLALLLAAAALALLAWRTVHNHAGRAGDARHKIVFWAGTQLGDDIWSVVNNFEKQNPQYQVVLGTAVSRNLTGDAQRLLCAVAGDVPPDVVWFDRFAVGEWAGRGALTDLTPYLAAQDPHDPCRIDLSEYYEWTVREASYAAPGSTDAPRIYGIPNSVDIRFLFCNANLLRQEGLVDEAGEPRPPRNWDELRDYANRLTRYNRPGDKSSGIARLGFGPNYGNSWLYMYAWQAGGEFMNADRTKVTMDAPGVVRALHYMTDVYDDLGGFKQVDAFQSSFQEGELDPFLKGQVAMKIDGQWIFEQIADWKRDMDFITTAAPMPQDQLDLGRKPLTWAGGWAFVIPTTAKNKDGAWKLIQYLRSHPVMEALAQGKREQKGSEGRLYMPGGEANRVFFEDSVQRYVEDNPQVPLRFKQAFRVLTDLMPNTLIRPVTPVGQVLWEKHRTAYEDAVNHEYRAEAQATGQDEVVLALRKAQAPVQKMLDEIMQPNPPDTQVSWTPYFIGYGGLIAALFALMYAAYRRNRREYSYKPREVWAALLFTSPWILGFVVFVGGPILFSIAFSFTRYDVLSPAHYVGLDNYRRIFQDDLFYKSLGNTVFMVLQIPLRMAASLVIALLLNRTIRGIGFYRTAFYMPAIVPLVASSLLWIWLLNPNQGALNHFIDWVFASAPSQWLAALLSRVTGHPVRFTAPLWLQDKNWSKPGLIVMNLWSAGGGMIIWLAGLQSIPEQLYEAASIDGANAWRRFTHITIPMLSPYILFNFVVGLIGTMQIFSEAFIMTEGGPNNSTLFYAYELFKEAFQFFRMGIASALAWILFLIVLALTLLQLWLSKKWVHYEQS